MLKLDSQVYISKNIPLLSPSNVVSTGLSSVLRHWWFHNLRALFSFSFNVGICLKAVTI